MWCKKSVADDEDEIGEPYLITVAGYPGEYNKHGEEQGSYYYYMRGAITGLENEDRLIAFKQMITTPGQTGGPVYYVTHEDKEFIVGVNLGGDGEKSWGTKFNVEIFRWMASTMNKEWGTEWEKSVCMRENKDDQENTVNKV